MARPIQPRTPAQHLVQLSRMARSIEVDTARSTQRKKRILTLLAQLIAELQKDIAR